MALFLVGEGVTISVEGVEYKADASGVVSTPNEFDDTLINCHGLTMYVPVPKAESKPKEKAKA